MSPLDLDITGITAAQMERAARSLGFASVRSFDPGMQAMARLEGTRWSMRDSFQIPTSESHPDFAEYAADAIERMARIAGIPMRQIFALMSLGVTDVFKVRAIDAVSGALPLAALSKFAGHVDSMMRGLAKTGFLELELRQQGLAGAAKEEFLSRLTAGQTEVGSYVLTVHSPLARGANVEPIADTAEPPARALNLAMSRQLVDLSRELDEVARGQADLAERVRLSSERTGLNFTTCDRLSRMIEDVNSGFEIALVPNPAQPLAGLDPEATKAMFQRPRWEMLREATELLRPGDEPATTVVIKGVVTDAHQEARADRGDTRIRVQGMVMAGRSVASFRTVSVRVDAEQLQLAAQALRTMQVVLLEGQLTNPGAAVWELTGEIALTPLDDPWEAVLPRRAVVEPPPEEGGFEPPVSQIAATVAPPETAPGEINITPRGPLDAVRKLIAAGRLEQPMTREQIDDELFAAFGKRYGPRPLSGAMTRAFNYGLVERQERAHPLGHLYWRRGAIVPPDQ